MEIKACNEPLRSAFSSEKDAIQKEEQLFTILNPASINPKISESWRTAVPTAWGQDALCGLND